MKPRNFIHFFVLCGLTLLFADGCASSPVRLDTTKDHPSTNTSTSSTFTFSDNSLYQVESSWTNDLGKSVKLGSLQGKAQIVVMFFTSCQGACPLLVNDLKRIEAALPESVLSHAGFVLMTVDFERDTPEILHAYRKRMNLSATRWTLLRGNSDDTLEFAALLGMKYKRESTGQFAHSNLITVLDPAGEIAYQQTGLSQEIAPVVNAIKQAISTAPAHIVHD